MQNEIIIAGFGGQGIMTMGTILATAGMLEGKNVTWLPSYGAEQRGGTANCIVVISDEMIASPIVDKPGFVVAMNPPSMDKFEPKLAPGGILFINSSLISTSCRRSDITNYRVPANELAEKIGNMKVANMVMLGVISVKTALVEYGTLEEMIRASAERQGAELMSMNLAALEAGRRSNLS